MEKLFLFSTLAILFLQGNAQDAKVSFGNTTAMMLQEGAENVIFKCFIDQPLMFILSNSVDFNLVQEWGGKTDTIHLFSNLQHMKGSPKDYSIAYSQVEGGIEFALTVLKVTPNMFGKLVCSCGEAKTEIAITVYKGLGGVSLQFASFPAVTETSNSSEPLAVDVGSYPVVCVAEGSNPGTTDIKLYVRGDVLPVEGETVVEPMETETPQYKSTARATLAVNVKHHEQSLDCVATSPTPGGETVTVSVKVGVNTYDPEITCVNGETYTGKKFVTLECVVDPTDVDITKYSYRIGDSGVIIAEGEKQMVQGHEISVSKEDVKVANASTKHALQLKLYQAEDWHFESDFVLVVESAGGHITEQSVKLMQVAGPTKPPAGPSDGNNNSAVMSTVSLTTLALVLAIYNLVL